MRFSQGAVPTIAIALVLLTSEAARAGQSATGDCQPYTLKGTVRECSASGSLIDQLRVATFIAGSEAVGETLARAVALEVATAPFGSSSGGFTFTFEPSTRTFARRAGTFGPSFSERALTIGKNKFSAGFNILRRSYDRLDDLDLHGFDAFRFEGGTLPVTFSRLDLQTRTDTIGAFAHYGLLDNLDVGILVPYERIAVSGTSSIYARPNQEVERVRLNASTAGLGDVALLAKYRFWTLRPESNDREKLEGGLAAAATVRLPTGNSDDLLGLGVMRTALSLIGSATAGRFSPHVNLGYEIWSSGVAVPKDFQGRSSIAAKDQLQYSSGLEYEMHPQLSLLVDVLGRYVRGTGHLGYQDYRFPSNFADVTGAEALVAIPSGVHAVILAPGAKWNLYRSVLVTGNALISITNKGVWSRFTPVLGIDWGF